MCLGLFAADAVYANVIKRCWLCTKLFLTPIARSGLVPNGIQPCGFESRERSSGRRDGIESGPLHHIIQILRVFFFLLDAAVCHRFSMDNAWRFFQSRFECLQ
jgi:hypothetical protein